MVIREVLGVNLFISGYVARLKAEMLVFVDLRQTLD